MTTALPTGPGSVPDYDDDPFAPREEHEDTNQLNGRRVTISPPFSDEAITLEFVDEYEKSFRYCTAVGKWFVWNGSMWEEDVQLRISEFIRNMCRAISGRVNNKPGLARSIASAKASGAVERLLRSEQQINLLFSEFDKEAMLLNTPSGVVDLTTGKLIPHAREYYMTKMTAVGPNDMATPAWNKFLDEVTIGNKDIQGFLQRMAGYCLTADVKEQAMFFLYGTGTNGKSVFVNAIYKIMGDYVHMSPIETFMTQQSEQHPQGLAALRGKRMIWTTEIEEGKRWNASRIKAATGADPITARFMRQDEFVFMPQFKLVSVGNFKPQFRSVDPAMRRRMNLIPFEADFSANMDLDLSAKLQREWPGILAWAIEGCVQWHKNGLQKPGVIAEATKHYLDNEDTTQNWISQCLVSKDGNFVTQEAIWRSWEQWSKGRGDHPGSMKRLLSSMEQKGWAWEQDPETRMKGLRGVGIKDGAAGSSYGSDHSTSDPRDYASSFEL